jgi:hypothetical protein
MIDCIGSNAYAVSRETSPQLIAGYDTGTSDILWTGLDWSFFPESVHVHIDQGYQSPAITTASVRDVEADAWDAGTAVVLSDWDAIRPTIYCDMDYLPSVLAAGWKGDLWLAIPGHTGNPPVVDGCTVVAVQNTQNIADLYDSSIVYDSYWPFNPPTEDDTMMSGLVSTGETDYTPFPAGSYSKIMFLRDFSNAHIRMALHSAAHGWVQISTVLVENAKPVTVNFNENDIDGVSLSECYNGPLGYTLA